MSPKTVLVLGAHPSADRFAHKAQKLLAAKGFAPVPVNPRYSEILGLRCYPDLATYTRENAAAPDTLTFYVNAERSSKMREEILAARPRRAVFNPGSENPALARDLEKAGVEVVQDCTLVMLNAGSF